MPEEDASSGRRRLAPAPDYGWYLLGWLGLVFVIVGGVSLAMMWYPVLIGNPQWEFGTVSSTYDSLPITALGLGLLLGAGVARGIRWWTRTAAALFLLLALLVIGGLVLYATNLPLALRAVTDPMSGFFMMRRDSFDPLAPELTTQGFKILLDIAITAGGRLKIAEQAYVFGARQHGESKLDAQVGLDFIGLLLGKVTGGLITPRFLSFGLVGGLGLVEIGRAHV